MKRVVKENQVVLAGRVGNIENKKEGLTIVSLSNRLKGNDTEWTNIAFTNPRGKKEGNKLADLANMYIEKGQYIVVIANKVQKGNYENYYAQAIDFGSKSKKEQKECS